MEHQIRTKWKPIIISNKSNLTSTFFTKTTANTTFANSHLCIQAIDEVEGGQSGCALRRQIRSQLEGRHYFDQIRTWMCQSRDNLSLLPKLENGHLESMFERWAWYAYDRTFLTLGRRRWANRLMSTESESLILNWREFSWRGVKGELVRIACRQTDNTVYYIA